MDDLFFATWPRVFAGATVFALLFALVEILGEAAISGSLAAGRSTYALAGVAFWGYLLVALWIRRNPARFGG